MDEHVLAIQWYVLCSLLNIIRSDEQQENWFNLTDSHTCFGSWIWIPRMIWHKWMVIGAEHMHTWWAIRYPIQLWWLCFGLYANMNLSWQSTRFHSRESSFQMAHFILYHTAAIHAVWCIWMSFIRCCTWIDRVQAPSNWMSVFFNWSSLSMLNSYLFESSKIQLNFIRLT